MRIEFDQPIGEVDAVARELENRAWPRSGAESDLQIDAQVRRGVPQQRRHLLR
jgi:hypothetical protein